MTIPPRSSYAIVPSFVLEDSELDEGAKVLYSRISMLSQDGRCWASNRHFAEKQKTSERTVQRWLQQLKEKEYIEIEVDNSGAQTTRNIWLINDFKKMFKGRHICHPPTTPMSGGGDTYVTPLNKDDNTYVTKESYVPTPESLELANIFLNEVLKEMPAFKKPSDLNGWAKDIDGMLRIDKRDPEVVKSIILWCTHDPFWKTNILSGAKLRKQFDQLSAKMPQAKGTSADSKKVILKELSSRYSKAVREGILIVGHDYVEFVAGTTSEHIKIDDFGFVEQIESNLRKRNVQDLSWLQQFRA